MVHTLVKQNASHLSIPLSSPLPHTHTHASYTQEDWTCVDKLLRNGTSIAKTAPHTQLARPINNIIPRLSRLSSECDIKVWHTHFRAPVVAERGCFRARLVFSLRSSSPWVGTESGSSLMSLSLMDSDVDSLEELESGVVDLYAVDRRMGLRSCSNRVSHTCESSCGCYFIQPQ